MIEYIKKLFGLIPKVIKPGALEDRPDPRDWKWEEFAPAFAPFEWEKGFDIEVELRKRLNNPNFSLPIKDQGSSSSCGGQAWATYGSVLEAIVTGTPEERSSKFIYAQTHVSAGGSSGRDNNKLVQDQGWGLEPLTPSYMGVALPTETFMRQVQDITDLARSKASKARAVSYASVNAFDIDAIAQAIHANYGAIIGYIGVNNGTAREIYPVPPREQEMPYTWRHFVYAGKASMQNGKKAIGIFNSWGRRVGVNGWQWFTEDYFKSGRVWYANTIIFNTSIPQEESFKHEFLVNMKFGDENEEVRALQNALQITGDFPANVKPTGYYGTITANAVYKFQLRNVISIPDRNNAGPKTRGALNALFK